MKIKVGDATQWQLNWLVAVLEEMNPHMRIYQSGMTLVWIDDFNTARYAVDWAQGGPIIEREKITLEYPREDYWTARAWLGKPMEFACGTGPTPLIAAMRCYVVSKMGDEVDVPNELKE